LVQGRQSAPPIGSLDSVWLFVVRLMLVVLCCCVVSCYDARYNSAGPLLGCSEMGPQDCCPCAPQRSMRDMCVSYRIVSSITWHHGSLSDVLARIGSGHDADYSYSNWSGHKRLAPLREPSEAHGAEFMITSLMSYSSWPSLVQQCT